MVNQSDLSISPGSDPSTVTTQCTALLHKGKWRLCNSGKGLERAFKFKTFNKTWSFMNEIAEECKRQKHHPEWSNVYNRVHVRWTTHNPEGLSERDTRMAGFCDEVALKFGELVPDEGEGGKGGNGGNAGSGTGEGEGGGTAKGLDDWRAEVKDCCGPKSG